MEISYTKCGDYLISNLTVPDEHYNIDKYGMLRREFLKEYHQVTYTVMLLNGTLLKHLAEIDKTCYEMLDRLIPQIAERERTNEELKAPTQWNGYGECVQLNQELKKSCITIMFIRRHTKMKKFSILTITTILSLFAVTSNAAPIPR